MGLFKDIKKLNEQGKEISKNWDPAAQMQQAMGSMAAMQDVLAHQSAAYSIGPNGQVAKALINASRDTGAQMNHQPVLEIDLLVMPEGGAPFPATVRQVVALSSLGRITPGAEIQVTYDPANPSVVLAAL